MKPWTKCGPNAGYQTSGAGAGKLWSNAGKNAGYQMGGHAKGNYS